MSEQDVRTVLDYFGTHTACENGCTDKSLEREDAEELVGQILKAAVRRVEALQRKAADEGWRILPELAVIAAIKGE